MPTAAGDLEQVCRFINTADLDRDADEIATPAGLRSWLAEHLVDPGPIDDLGHGRALALRAALRQLAAANNGAGSPAAGLPIVEAAAAAARLRARFGEAGVRLEPEAPGIDGALGWLVARVYAAIADGSFARVKACARDDCRWVFYDASRNRSATWCSMRVCGNRTKAERFRRRHARS